MPRNILSQKRPRSITLEDSSPSKASRYTDRDRNELDSEGFELLQPSEPKTPDTINIFPSNMTTPAPGSPQNPFFISEAESGDAIGEDALVVPGGEGESKINVAYSASSIDLEQPSRWEREGVSQIQADIAMGGISIGAEKDPTPQWQLSPEAIESAQPDKKGNGKVVLLRKKNAVSSRKMAVYGERNLRRVESVGTIDPGGDIDDPGTPSRANRFVRLRDNRFCRPRKVSLMHTKEVVRSPSKNETNAASIARRVDLLMGRDKRKAPLNSEKENCEPLEDVKSMQVE